MGFSFLPGVMLLGLLAGGCQSTGPAPSSRLAWVTIANRTQAEVEAATLDVFTQHSFQGGRTEPGHFKFEKRGSSWDQFAYGGWIDPNVWRRVLVTVKPMDDRTVLVDCDAYLVRFRGDYRFEEVQKIGRRHRGAYQRPISEEDQTPLTPALSHPMGEGELVPTPEQTIQR